LKFSRVSHEVQYRSSWHAGVLTTVNVRKLAPSTRKKSHAQDKSSGKFPSVKTSSAVQQLSQEKKNDLKNMLKWLPLEDKQYYEKTVLK